MYKLKGRANVHQDSLRIDNGSIESAAAAGGLVAVQGFGVDMLDV